MGVSCDILSAKGIFFVRLQMAEYRNIQAYSFEPERSQANSDESEDEQAQEIVDSQNVLSLTAQVDRETPTLTDRRTNNLGWCSCSECIIMPKI